MIIQVGLGEGGLERLDGIPEGSSIRSQGLDPTPIDMAEAHATG